MPHAGHGLSSRALGRSVSDMVNRHHAWRQEPEDLRLKPGLRENLAGNRVRWGWREQGLKCKSGELPRGRGTERGNAV